jgi:hypothetical protein
MDTRTRSPARWSFGSFRGWHLWLSIALSLPILIVALTAIFIAHGKSLGLKEIQVNAGWLPGMGAGKPDEAEPRALWVAPDGVQWLGTKAGLYRVRGEQVERVEDLGRADVRGMVGLDAHLVVATTKGLYRVAQVTGAGERVVRGDFWSVASTPQGLVAVGKNDQLLHSNDAGLSWNGHEAGASAAQRVAAGMTSGDGGATVPLSKLVMDLHTGKAFLGKQYEWVWIDLIGATMALLTLTGLVMWWRGQRRKAATLAAQMQAGVSAAAAVTPVPARAEAT